MKMESTGVYRKPDVYDAEASDGAYRLSDEVNRGNG